MCQVLAGKYVSLTGPSPSCRRNHSFRNIPGIHDVHSPLDVKRDAPFLDIAYELPRVKTRVPFSDDNGGVDNHGVESATDPVQDFVLRKYFRNLVAAGV